MGTSAPWFQSFAGASDVTTLRPCGAPLALVHHFRSAVTGASRPDAAAMAAGRGIEIATHPPCLPAQIACDNADAAAASAAPAQPARLLRRGPSPRFKIAADELFLTPSAVSHQMKELEDSLGVRLFERKTRAVELTSAGDTLLEEVGPLLDVVATSLTRIARRNNRVTLRMLLPPFASAPRRAVFL